MKSQLDSDSHYSVYKLSQRVHNYIQIVTAVYKHSQRVHNYIQIVTAVYKHSQRVYNYILFLEYIQTYSHILFIISHLTPPSNFQVTTCFIYNKPTIHYSNTRLQHSPCSNSGQGSVKQIDTWLRLPTIL